MTLDNIFWIASCTKMITGVACMQLVEQGKLSLDDAAQTESLCPELKDLKVLQADGKLVAKKRGITLRMLLTHTGECFDAPYSSQMAADTACCQPDLATPSSTTNFVTTASRSGMTSSRDTRATSSSHLCFNPGRVGSMGYVCYEHRFSVDVN